MEWLSHDYGNGGDVDILAVDAYSGIELCTLILLGEASKKIRWQIIFNNFKNSQWTHHLTKLNIKKVAMWIVFDSGRNVYVVEEPFYFHSTPINLIIKA
jgi:hypothetical protein